VPVRLLPDTYDIPQPYTPAPRAYVNALLTGYDTATVATARVTATLDNLATAINAPSSILAAAHQAATAARPELRLQTSLRSLRDGQLVPPAPGRTEKRCANSASATRLCSCAPLSSTKQHAA
jgi:hypothetical protein